MNHNKQGFTLIELMLAMTFVSALLLAIAMTVIQISNIYTKGLTLKEVNQAGRTISTELKRGISQSAPFLVSSKYINQKSGGVSYGGRLCVGQYSYIWNYGSALVNSGTDKNNSNVYAGGSTKMSFVKAPDSSGSYCSSSSKAIDKLDAIELLASGDSKLALHGFTIANNSTDPKSDEGLYSITFTIGTNDQKALDATQTTCNAPNVAGSDINYCFVNKFNIVARAINGLQ